ncbi:alpha-amylase family glycosyl hydrolase [Thalassotalea mangrovi]|uniref:Alpha-amlyase n=1 Tax=Thalassotalea mangrovi TaxID=2572245 RepID=A0A4U1B3R9_9GAMM|nr:alpha-amylase family glycosyl hydrolase [Thalassotalea mangrovi]TKB44220.1 alpha-amlyase [Thalassotalea mangrovi]
MNQGKYYYPLEDYVKLKHPSWCINASIYEVNIRQYTKEGTFEAFSEHLPRLKKLGVKILWLMPVHPIGQLHRKGELGSPYAITDHMKINPELGTDQDFKQLIDDIHSLDMYVIIDWVANHSAWDNALTQTHPHWYKKTDDGTFRSTTWFDWDDIIEFDFQQSELRHYMINAMRHYLQTYQIDGFRCDVAGFVPLNFWHQARAELDPEHKFFWLAEWEERDLHQSAFNMSYAWQLNDLLEDIAQQKRHAENLCGYIAKHNNAFPDNAMRMNFLDNHDKNAWDGSVQQRFGEAEETLLAMTLLMDGMPLLYSGQEVASSQSLAFFDKDPIQWPDDIEQHPRHLWLQALIRLKSQNPALQNGRFGGVMNEIKHDQRDKVIAFYRQNKRHCVVFIANLTPQPIRVKLQQPLNHLPPLSLFISSDNSNVILDEDLEFQGWGYAVFAS